MGVTRSCEGKVGVLFGVNPWLLVNDTCRKVKAVDAGTSVTHEKGDNSRRQLIVARGRIVNSLQSKRTRLVS